MRISDISGDMQEPCNANEWIRETTGGLDFWLSRFYTLVAPVYDRLWARKELRRNLVARLKLKPSQRVLETGVGTGANLPLICRRLGSEGTVEGIDLSPGMLKVAHRRSVSLPCTVSLRLGNASALPYPDDHFDAVLHLGGINFFSEREKAVREMVRVAKPGATIVICDETLRLKGRLGKLVSGVILRLCPRLRPPEDLVPPQAEVVRLDFSPRGFFYILELVKKGETQTPSES